MKIAVVTDDGKTISAHFGRAAYFAVITVEDGRVVGQEMRSKPSHDGHHHHQGAAEIQLVDAGASQPGDLHGRMAAAIPDCEVVISRGMGNGAYAGFRDAGVRAVLTDVREIDEAIRQYLSGELTDHPERLH